MKKTILYIMFVCLFVCQGYASYTYEVYVYDGSKHLFNVEKILVDQQGGMDYLFLNDFSSATIQGTSTFSQGVGGIGHALLYDSSSLIMSDGELVTLAVNSNATVKLTGGWIYQIQSNQLAWKQAGDPPAPVSNPHITIVYSGALPTRNSTTQVLTGLWGDGSVFSIYLPNITGYSPAMDNIRFELIPEPATLALLGLGGLLLRRTRI